MKLAVDTVAYRIQSPLAAELTRERCGGVSRQERIVLHERLRLLLPSLESIGDEDFASRELGEGLEEALEVASKVVQGGSKCCRVRTSFSEEQVLFKGYNAAKRVARARIRDIDDESGMDSLERAVSALRNVHLIRQAITESNIPLVLAMVKRVLGERPEHHNGRPFSRRPIALNQTLDHPTLCSEGNFVLLKAIEKFDYRRGFKFSTYSCKGIIKRICGALSREKEHQRRFEQLDEYRASFVLLDEDTPVSEAVKGDAIELFQSAFLTLTELEQFVLKHRFGLQDQQPRTLVEVGLEIGVTKERVRQIQNGALGKLRKILLLHELNGNLPFPLLSSHL